MQLKMAPLKRAFLHRLDQLGYVLLKKPEYVELATAKSAPETAVRNGPAGSIEPQQLTTSLPEHHNIGPASSLFLKKAEAALGPLPDHAHAIFDAVEYIVKNKIPGDVVDCGEGVPTDLSLIA